VPDARGSTGSPTVRRRELGTLLRALRTERGLTVEHVAAALLCSPSKVSRMETGQRGATARDIRDLCELYGVTDPSERERLTTLAREGKQQGWWQSYALPYTTFVGLEQEATSITIFHSAVVPGLLQVADYTRAIHLAGIPRLDDTAIGERIEERHTRQQLLTRANSPQVEVVLDEAVLHRPLGGATVMREQLDRILVAAKYPNVTFRVVPFNVGAHPALESNFIVLEFAGLAPTIVYVEGLIGQLYMERQQEVDHYLQVVSQLRDMALSPKDSVAFVARIRDTYNNELTVRRQAVAIRRGWLEMVAVSVSGRCRRAEGCAFVTQKISDCNSAHHERPSLLALR
jgi:transcriptional regulator with XRE-family HTH domain